MGARVTVGSGQAKISIGQSAGRIAVLSSGAGRVTVTYGSEVLLELDLSIDLALQTALQRGRSLSLGLPLDLLLSASLQRARALALGLDIAMEGSVTLTVERLLSGLLHYWSLEEASGTRADLNGSSDLTPTGSIGNAAGKSGSAAQFVAADQRSLEAAANLPLTGQEMTVNLWVSLTDQDLGGGFVRSISNNEFLFGVKGPSGLLEVVFNSFGTEDRLTYVLPAGALDSGWAMATGLYSAQRGIELYVNGVLVNSTSGMTGAWNPAICSVALGHSVRGYLDGVMDEVGIWDRALSPEDIATLYNSGQGLFYSSFN